MTGNRVWQTVAAVLIALAAIVAGTIGYRHYTQSYTIAVADDGEAVARVVATSFHGASALKVASIAGIVQVPSTDSRLFGLLNSDRVMKAPFAVDYFVDVSHLTARDVAWDQRRRTLTIDVPAVVPGAPNIDESRATVMRTRGLFVTRSAAEALSRRASLRARQTAAAEAARPVWIGQARDRARVALAALLGTPLQAAGIRPATIRVRFPDERGDAPVDGRMQRSRSLDAVFGLDR